MQMFSRLVETIIAVVVVVVVVIVYLQPINIQKNVKDVESSMEPN